MKKMFSFFGLLDGPKLHIVFLVSTLIFYMQHESLLVLPGCQAIKVLRPFATTTSCFVSRHQLCKGRRHGHLSCPAATQQHDPIDQKNGHLAHHCNMEVMACAGIQQKELTLILDAAALAIEQMHVKDANNNGEVEEEEDTFQTLKIPLRLEIPSWIHKGRTSGDLWAKPAKPDSIPGATGRVLLLSYWFDHTDDDMSEVGLDHDVEVLEEIVQQAVSFQIDRLLMEKKIGQPILVSVKPQVKGFVMGDLNKMDKTNDTMEQKVFMKKGQLYEIMKDIVEEEVEQYGLIVRCPMRFQPNDIASKVANNNSNERRLPDIHVEIDGAIMTNETEESYFDTSSIFVFDNFINDDLRVRLLDTIHQRNDHNNHDDEWDDMVLGPNPKCYEKGGLCDTLDESSTSVVVSPSWGLKEELIQDLCFQEHSAIVEVEQMLCNMFANDFVVSRLPEAVLGANVSPLTVNAPTYGDEFAYHIDADPNQLPPSPWTDVFGRYPNRLRGKPRFVSCLLYLNAEWNDEWGAPTQFYDPPTAETFRVYPRPGRCVIMDQDITHTVVAPTEAAGARPRYSLVWKLILHPKQNGQSVKMFPESIPVRIGSAKSPPNQ